MYTYSTQLAPSINVFSDHIEVFSYGNSLSVQSKDDFLDGVSKPINPKLMDIFMKIHKLESSGKGVNTIKKKYGCHFKKIFADSIHNLNLFLKLYLSSTFFFLLKSTCVYISVVDIDE